MISRDEVAHLKRFVWPAASVRPPRVYAVLDCARDPAIYGLVHRSYRERCCLFAGELDPELERASPFLLELQPGDSLTDELLLRGWNEAWMVLLRSENSFRSVRRHLRTLLRVQMENGGFLLFRYYDPRVMRVYLPTCTPAELTLLFGEDVVEWFCCSDSGGATTGYRLQDEALCERHSAPVLV